MTMKELIIRHDAYLLDRWWGIAVLSSHLYNLQTIVHNALTTRHKMKPKSPAEMHPFLNPDARKRKITPRNISLLKAIGNAMCSRR